MSETDVDLCVIVVKLAESIQALIADHGMLKSDLNAVRSAVALKADDHMVSARIAALSTSMLNPEGTAHVEPLARLAMVETRLNNVSKAVDKLQEAIDPRLKRLRFEPGDILLFKAKGHLSLDNVQSIHETLAAIAPGVPKLVLDDSLEISVLTKTEIEARAQ